MFIWLNGHILSLLRWIARCRIAGSNGNCMFNFFQMWQTIYWSGWITWLPFSCERLWNYTNKNLPSNPLGVMCHSIHGCQSLPSTLFETSLFIVYHWMTREVDTQVSHLILKSAGCGFWGSKLKPWHLWGESLPTGSSLSTLTPPLHIKLDFFLMGVT